MNLEKLKHKIKYDKAIFFTLLLKVILVYLFSSGVQQEVIHKFTTLFVEDFLSAWSSADSIFPYPALMLYILTPFAWLSSHIASPALSNVIFSIPLFLFDYICLLSLHRLSRATSTSLTLYYYASPIILFSTFMHGQLDIIPTALLILSLYFTSLRKNTSAFLFLSLSITCKLSSLIAYPFLVLYVLKTEQVKLKKVQSFLPLLLPLTLFFLINLPFWQRPYFISNVFFSKEQNLLYANFLEILNLKLYLAPLAITLVLARFAAYRRVNFSLLVSALGVVFSLLVILVYPNPGWFVWSLPFLSIIYCSIHNEKKFTLAFFLSYNIVYLVFFTLFYQHPLNDLSTLILLDTPLLFFQKGFIHESSIFFTLLSAIGCLNVYALLSFSLKNNQLVKRRFESTLIGIGGDSASGKSTLLSLLQQVLGKANVLPLEGDGDHRWVRGDSNWQEKTHLNPKSNFLHRQSSNLKDLKKGKKISLIEYNHSNGLFEKPRLVKPKDFIIISGLHPFYLPKSRFLIDLKIFLDTNSDLRKLWKLKRDIKKRGYTPAQVIEQIEKRKKDYDKYISPQKSHADLVINFYPQSPIIDFNSDHTPQVNLKLYINSNIDLDYLIHYLNESSFRYNHDYTHDLKMQFIDFQEKPTADQIREIFSKVLSKSNDIAPDFQQITDGFNGLIQIFFLVALKHQMDFANEL